MTPLEFARLIDLHGPPLVLYARQWCARPRMSCRRPFSSCLGCGSCRIRLLPGCIEWCATEPLTQVGPTGADSGASPPLLVLHGGSSSRRLMALTPRLRVAALERLPVEQREVIVARLWGALSFEQIAELAAVPPARLSAGIARDRCPAPGVGISMSDDPLIKRLSQFTPDGSGLDRDGLLFAAGRASARPSRCWPALAGMLAVSQVVILAIVFWPHSGTPVPDLIKAPPIVTVEPAPPLDHPEPSSPAESPGLWAVREQIIAADGKLPLPTPV